MNAFIFTERQLISYAIQIIGILIFVAWVTQSQDLRANKLFLAITLAASIMCFQWPVHPMLLLFVIVTTGYVWAGTISHHVSYWITSLIMECNVPAINEVPDLTKAIRYYQDGKNKLAIRQLECIARKYPNDFQTQFMLIRILGEDCNNLRRAKWWVEKIIENKEISFSQKACAATHYDLWSIQEGNRSNRELMTAKLSRLSNVADKYGEVRALYDRKKYKEAEATITKMLQGQPNDTEGLILMAQIQSEGLKNSQLTTRTLYKLKTVSPIQSITRKTASNQKSEKFIVNVPRLQKNSIDTTDVPSNQSAKALTHYQEEIVNLCNEGRYGTAVELMEQYLLASPTDAKAWMFLASIYAEHCHDIHGANKTIRRMYAINGITAEEKEKANEQYKKWVIST